MNKTHGAAVAAGACDGVDAAVEGLGGTVVVGWA